MEKQLRRGVVAAAWLFVLSFIVLSMKRISYPFQLEWMEGGSLEHVHRLLERQPIYGPPDLEFTPFIYTPLFYYLGAVNASWLGEHLFALRIISFIASLGTLLCLFLIVRRETGDVFSGSLAAGLYAATFHLCEGWFDLARTDSLFLCLVLWASYLLRFGTSFVMRTMAGFLIFLSFFSKQVGLLACIPFLCHETLRFPKRTWGAWVGLGGSLLVSTLWMNFQTDGWYVYYCWELPRQHRWAWHMLFHFLTKDTLIPLTVAAGMALFHLSRVLNRPWRDPGWHAVCLAVGLILAALTSRLHSGGYVNVLMPAYAGIALLFGLAESNLKPVHISSQGPEKGLHRMLFVVLCMTQFLSLVYWPGAYLPSKEDRSAGRYVQAVIKDVEGETFCPGSGYLASRAGKASSVHPMALWDVLRGDVSRQAGDELVDRLKEALQTERYTAVLLQTNWLEDPLLTLLFREDLERHYKTRSRLFLDPEVFWPVAGWKTRPEVLYEPE